MAISLRNRAGRFYDCFAAERRLRQLLRNHAATACFC
jgi:hypothetical protein